MKELWLYFLRWLEGELQDLSARPGGVEGPAVTGHARIEQTGYLTEEERAELRERLRAFCETAVNNSDWIKHDITGDGKPETFCNHAVTWIAERMGCHDFPQGTLAGDMIGIMETGGSGWRRDSGERAHRHAWRGGLAIAAKRYAGPDHVAVVYPEAQMAASPSWGRQVPWVANVGKLNQVMPASRAFPVAEGEPDYYVWGETA